MHSKRKKNFDYLFNNLKKMHECKNSVNQAPV